MTSAIDISLGQLAATLVLVGIAVAVSFWQRAGLEEDIGIAVGRSFIQLTAVGFVIQFIFNQDKLVFVIALISGMVLFGALTARGRARNVPGAFRPLLISLALAATTTLVLVVALGVFEPKPRFLVPVGGMVVGNSMTAAAVALNRLGDEVRSSAGRIEATLALGATATQAMLPVLRRSLRSAMIPLIDSTKTTGIVFFPRHDGRHPARRRVAHRCRAAPADPPVDLARQRGASRADRDGAGLPPLLHAGAPAARPAARGRAGVRQGYFACFVTGVFTVIVPRMPEKRVHT